MSAFFGVLAVLVGFGAVGERSRARALTERTELAARRLGVSAGLRDRSGATTARPLAVAVVQEGGPLWAHPVLEQAFSADPAFEVAASAHLVRVEVVADDHHLVIAPALFRQGWGLRLESPLRIRLLPWVATITALLGLGICLVLRRPIGEGLFAAGLFCQGLTASVPWPAPLLHQSLGAALSDGPLGAAAVSFAASLSDTAVAIAIGGVVMCTILVAFDHRRSPHRGRAMALRGVAGGVGVIAWIEASTRVGSLAWGLTLAGVISLVLVAASWGTAAVANRRN